VTQASGSSLTAGAWEAFGTTHVHSTLDITSAGSFTTLAAAATVELSGPNSDFTNIDGASGLATIHGNFELLGGQSFTTAGNLTTTGKMTLSPGSILTVNGSYTQTSTATLTVQAKVVGATLTVGEIVSGSSGTVTLAGKLKLMIVGTTLPALNSPFTILNDGNASNAISGTFTGLPEGGTFTVTVGATTMTFKISYVGGDGNDVTLTRTA
jgi:hypothetical protein